MTGPLVRRPEEIRVACPMCKKELRPDRLVARRDEAWVGASRMSIEFNPHNCDVSKWAMRDGVLAQRVEVPVR